MKLPSSRDHSGRHQSSKTERRPQNLPPPVSIDCSAAIMFAIIIEMCVFLSLRPFCVLNSLCRTHLALVLPRQYIGITRTVLTI